MKIKKLKSCPNCNRNLVLKSLSCETCDIEIRGNFNQSPFNDLNEEQNEFLLVFIECEGKIKDMEKALGISYPSVKSKLAELKSVLKIRTSKPKKLSKIEILNMIENKEITPEEAILLLAKPKTRGES